MSKGVTFLAIREIGGLKPANEIGEEIMRRIRIGDLIEITVVKKRDIKLHHLYWVLLGLIWANLPEETKPAWPTIDSFHRQMKILCKVVEEYQTMVETELPSGEILPPGAWCFQVGSISFAEMDDIQFVEFFQNVCFVAIKWWLPTVTIQQLRWECEKITGYSVESSVEMMRRRRLKREEEQRLIASVQPKGEESDDALEA